MKLSTKTQYKLYKEYKNTPRVVVYTGSNESTLAFVDPNVLLIGDTEKLITLKDFKAEVEAKFLALTEKYEAVLAENEALRETINNLLNIKE